MPEGKTESKSKVQARNLAEQASYENEDQTKSLEEQAKAQEKQQAEELKAGAQAKADPAQESDVPAAKRTGREDEKTQNGFMDQMSARSGGDVYEGHFCTVDLNAKGVKEAYKAAGLVNDEDDFVGGDYGVYIEPGTLDKDSGIPVTAVVRLRDATNARVAVPYDALSPAEARGR